MKVESIHIQNFKCFEDLKVSFKNKVLNEASDRFLVLGDNGSGKTTLLQAIALPLSLATRRINSLSDFEWLGFLPGRYSRWGTPQIELEVSFEAEELALTRELARRWYEAQTKEFQFQQKFIEPGDSLAVKVILNGNSCEIGNNPSEREQFQGRYYTQYLIDRGNKFDESLRGYLKKLPGIFWFDQFRNLGANPNGEFKRQSSNGQNNNILGIDSLFESLINWRMQQILRIKNYQVEYLNQLEKLYQKIFPSRWFELESLSNPDSPNEESTYFLINDGHRTYDITEMSAGEQSIFSILFQFVNHQIAYSVVLIDEIDLNLHPPAAQFFVSQLSRIAPTCQFIFTTHSELVSNLVGESDTYRLSGGVLCL
jgi:predicted ATP-dependent endonuclease of OLD family